MIEFGVVVHPKKTDLQSMHQLKSSKLGGFQYV